MKASALFFSPSSHWHSQCRGELVRKNTKRLLGALTLITLMLESASGFSATPPEPLPSASATLESSQPKPLVKAAPSGPSWGKLTPEQQQALLPLILDWNGLSEAQKHKWLEISKNYRALTPTQKAKLNSRMSEWVALSPQQRAQARLNFGKTKELSRQLTPEEKKAKWNAYQALSPEEKQKLVAKANPKPSGAATALKPVAPQKLATLPADGNKRVHKAPPASAPKIVALPSVAPASAASAAAPAPVGAASSPTQR
jgi:hypothetical protein